MCFYALFEHHFTDACEPHQTLDLNDVHINLGQKQLTAPVYINNTNVKPYFLGQVEETQLNGSGWSYLRIQIIRVTMSKLD